jgi:hypothetical protein
VFQREPVLTLLLILLPYPLFLAFIAWLVFRRSPLQATIIILAWLLAVYGYTTLRISH